MKEFVCQTCSKNFSSKKCDKNRTPKFCSKICYAERKITKEWIEKISKARIGKIPWNKGKKIWDTRPHPKGTLGKRRIRSGEKSHFWKGGVSEPNMKIRKSSDYSEWRKKVFERDNFTCIICNQKGGKLNADHILPFSTHPSLRFDVLNGRTLCVSCHLKTDTFGSKMNKKRRILGVK